MSEYFHIIKNVFLRLLGKEPVDDMPRWIVWYSSKIHRGGDRYLSDEYTVGEIIKTRSIGLNRYGYEYMFHSLNGQRIPFWREKTYKREWVALTEDFFKTKPEYEMFLMLNPKIKREDIE